MLNQKCGGPWFSMPGEKIRQDEGPRWSQQDTDHRGAEEPIQNKSKGKAGTIGLED